MATIGFLVALDVADALSAAPATRFGFSSMVIVKGALRNRKTHWHDVRNGPAIGRGKMPDPLRHRNLRSWCDSM